MLSAMLPKAAQVRLGIVQTTGKEKERGGVAASCLRCQKRRVGRSGPLSLKMPPPARRLGDGEDAQGEIDLVKGEGLFVEDLGIAIRGGIGAAFGDHQGDVQFAGGIAPLGQDFVSASAPGVEIHGADVLDGLGVVEGGLDEIDGVGVGGVAERELGGAPSTDAKTIPASMICGVTRKEKASSLNVVLPMPVVTPFKAKKTSRQPRIPPKPASSTDSTKKLSRILPRENPSTRNVPISRARRATAAYMVFMAAKLLPMAMMIDTKIPRYSIGAAERVCRA